MLEPDRDALVALLREAADAGAQERARRGAAARAAAAALGWDAVAARYAERIRALATRARAHRPPRARPRRSTAPVRACSRSRPTAAADELAALLRAWARPRRPARPDLYLVADPARDGTPEQVEAPHRRRGAAAGIDLDHCADIKSASCTRHPAATPRCTPQPTASCRCTAPARATSASPARRGRPADLGLWLAARSTPQAA